MRRKRVCKACCLQSEIKSFPAQECLQDGGVYAFWSLCKRMCWRGLSEGVTITAVTEVRIETNFSRMFHNINFKPLKCGGFFFLIN